MKLALWQDLYFIGNGTYGKLSLLLSSGKPNPFSMRLILARLIFNELLKVLYSLLCAEFWHRVVIRKNPSLRSTKSQLWKAPAPAVLRLQWGEQRGMLGHWHSKTCCQPGCLRLSWEKFYKTEVPSACCP